MASCLVHYFVWGGGHRTYHRNHPCPSHFWIWSHHYHGKSSHFVWMICAPSEASVKSRSVLLVKAMSRSVVLWPGQCWCLWPTLPLKEGHADVCGLCAARSTFDCVFRTSRGQTKYKAYTWPVLLVCFLSLPVWTTPLTMLCLSQSVPTLGCLSTSELGKEFKWEMPWQGDLLVSKPGCACL